MHLGILSKCRFCFSGSHRGLRFCTSNKLPGVGITGRLQTTHQYQRSKNKKMKGRHWPSLTFIFSQGIIIYVLASIINSKNYVVLQGRTCPPIGCQTPQRHCCSHNRHSQHFQMMPDQPGLQYMWHYLRNGIRSYLHTTRTSWEVGRILLWGKDWWYVLYTWAWRTVTLCHLLMVPWWAQERSLHRKPSQVIDSQDRTTKPTAQQRYLMYKYHWPQFQDHGTEFSQES